MAITKHGTPWKTQNLLRLFNKAQKRSKRLKESITVFLSAVALNAALTQKLA